MKFDNIIIVVIFLCIVAFAGLLAGSIYFSMATLQGVLETVNVTLPVGENGTQHANLTSFQDVMEIVIYPFLELRDTLPYLTYFLVFALIIALGFTAYMSSKNPIFFIVHLLWTFVITYFSIILANTYTTLLVDPFINSIMIDFAIYNKLMLYLPQILFFISLIFGVIAFVSIMKPQGSKFDSGLSYGGDY